MSNNYIDLLFVLKIPSLPLVIRAIARAKQDRSVTTTVSQKRMIVVRLFTFSGSFVISSLANARYYKDT